MNSVVAWFFDSRAVCDMSASDGTMNKTGLMPDGGESYDYVPRPRTVKNQKSVGPGDMDHRGQVALRVTEGPRYTDPGPA